MQVEGGRWKVNVFASHIRDNMNFNPQRSEGEGEFVSVVPHPALHRRKFASDEADFHYPFNPDLSTCLYISSLSALISRLCPNSPLAHSSAN